MLLAVRYNRIQARLEPFLPFLGMAIVYEGLVFWVFWLVQAPDGLLQQYPLFVNNVSPPSAFALSFLDLAGEWLPLLALLPPLFAAAGIRLALAPTAWRPFLGTLLGISYFLLANIFCAAIPFWSVVGLARSV
ncbi:MAG: hypothetical protein HYZ53_12055 [Planctomycetes bacterium]|nr:hypothetical protein [Planctomycetota bacterium]